MSDSRKFLHPEAIQSISRLELRARHVVEGFLAGMHHSPYFGRSVEFRQHREYVSGDDLRHVDWKVWGREDRLYVKQFEADTNLRCHLVVDSSASMTYGNGPLNKYEYAATIAVCLAHLLLRQQDAVGCITFDESVREVVPVRCRRNHIESIANVLNIDEPKEKTNIGRVLENVAKGQPRRGMVVLISDLLVDVDATTKILKRLQQRGHEVLVFHILDDDELDFPFSGPVRFEGLETEDHLNCNPRSLRNAYLNSMDEFLSTLSRFCATQSIDYKLIRTSQPLDVALSTFLGTRKEAVGGGG